jgi:DNA invertase Pin-like site-specific DNA recombinase
MGKAIGYCRVSTVQQATEGVSLDAPERRIRAWCEAQGLILEEVYVDAGASGSRADNRPELQRALAACRKGCVLVFFSLSRLSRSTRDVLAILDRLQGQGADLASVSESLDTSSPSGRLVLGMMSAVGAFEREVLAERTQMATQYLQAQGRYIGGNRPTGWLVGPDGRLREHPEEQRLIERALELRRAGMGLRKIAATLMTEGFVPNQGTRFHPEQVRRWVRTEAWRRPAPDLEPSGIV